MKNNFLIRIAALLVLASSTTVQAVEIVRYNLFGQPGTQVSNSPEYEDAAVTGMDLTRSPNLLFTTSGVNSMNSSNWSIGEYYSFGFTVDAGFQVSLTELQIGTRSSSSGPKFLVLYSSVDGFTTPLGSIDHSPGGNFVNTIFDLSSLTGLTGNVEFRLRVDENKRASDETPMAAAGTNRVTNYFIPGEPNTDSGGFRINGTVTPIGGGASVVGGFVYHVGYSGLGSAVDTEKSLHKEGVTPQELTYDNLINSSRGINGVLFEIQNLGNGGALSASDFVFQMSPQGAFVQGVNPPTGWAAAPAPSSVSVTPGSPDEVLIQWTNNVIQNRWLRVTILANSNTGLTQPEVYYVGHLLGESTGPSAGFYTVSFTDITEIRALSGQSADSGNFADIDKNGTVSFADITAMRANVGTQLTNITVPVGLFE